VFFDKFSNYHTIGSEVAIIPEYRGLGSMEYVFSRAVWHKITHPFTQLIFIETVLNFKVYKFLVNGLHAYPNPKHEIPEAFKKIIEDYIKKSDYESMSDDTLDTKDNSNHTLAPQLKEYYATLYNYFLKKTNNNKYGLIVICSGTFLSLYQYLNYSIMSRLKKWRSYFKRLYFQKGEK
jgi:hypothetical protein